MAVCQFFLQGTCKFGNRCYNDHIKNHKIYPIYCPGRGMRGGPPRGGRGGPRFQQQQQQQPAEPACVFYERMACEQSQRLKNPKGKVTVVSRNGNGYRNNQPQQNGSDQLNLTSDSKSSGKSNGYLKQNGFESAVERRRRRHEDDDEDDIDMFNGDDDDQNLTQENDSVSVSRSVSQIDDSSDGDEIGPGFTTRHRRRARHSPVTAACSRAVVESGGLTPIKASSPKSRTAQVSCSSNHKDAQQVIGNGCDSAEDRKWLRIYNEDINFFRSVIPTMASLDARQKSSVRAQILQILHNARYLPAEKK